MTPSERISQAFLYGGFGAAWSAEAGSLAGFTASLSPTPWPRFGAAAWWIGLLSMPFVLAAVFMARPVRTPHRYTWAATAAIAVMGFLRGWNLTWSLIAAGVVGAAMVVPRRSVGLRRSRAELPIHAISEIRDTEQNARSK